MPEVFSVFQGNSPLLLSFPHDGRMFPDQIRIRLNEIGRSNIDCDWYVSELYSFAEELDVSFVKSHYSRYVIDLNRSTTGELLYPGKMETGICPVTTFEGANIYLDGHEPDEDEIRKRIEDYWQPYHQHIVNELERLKAINGYAILWDAHSIKGEVPTLFEGSLPHLNFGTANEQSCSPELSAYLVSMTKKYSDYSVVLNGRFKGGYLTRNYGNPDKDIHAIQLEINQDIYLARGSSPEIDVHKAAKVKELLKTFITVTNEFKPKVDNKWHLHYL